MSLKGAIIVNQEVGHNQYKIDRLLQEFKNFDVELEVLSNNGTLAEIKNNEIKLNFNADFVIYLDKDIYLARFIEKCGIRLFNKADFIKLCDDKVLTFIGCSNMGIRMPKTLAGPLMYREPKPEEYKFLDKVEKELGYPMVVKKVYGSLGDTGYFLETTPYDPRSPYSSSKASSDHIVMAYYHTYGLPITLSNCTNNYGPFQFPEKLLPLMISNIKDGKKICAFLSFCLSFVAKSCTFASDYEKDTIRLFGKYLPLTHGRRSVQTVHNPERC